MKLIDNDLLDVFRLPGPCEWCGKTFLSLEPHHIFGRGLGGATRMDIRKNLISLCRGCHQQFHDGHILRCDLLAKVAAREGVLQPDLESELYKLIRTTKRSG